MKSFELKPCMPNMLVKLVVVYVLLLKEFQPAQLFK